MNLDGIDEVDEFPARPRKDIPAADLELLTLAARALGARFEEVDGEGYGNLHFADGSVVYAWNPLVHNDDAFTLSGNLCMNVRHDDPAAVVAGWLACERAPAEVQRPGPWFWKEWLRDHADNRVATTRRAVTRAAAEIGKQRS